MKIYNTTRGIIIENEGKYFLENASCNWDELVNRDNLYEYLLTRTMELPTVSHDKETLLAPIGTQEVWAAGVTYLRSREARMEESKKSGGADFYNKVYDAERPELFFKAAPYRVAGTNAPLRIRKDSKWNVPEPELTLYATSSGNIVGYAIGNDMSSRDIEGENPLYLPQAKCYDGAAAIGPALYVPSKPIDPDTELSMKIIREGKTVFEGTISINQMKRKHTELIDFLFREMSFSHGVYLMTGTCLVPDDGFTLQKGDEVQIEIGCIGVLKNNIE